MDRRIRAFFASWMLFSVVALRLAYSSSMLPAYRLASATWSKCFFNSSRFVYKAEIGLMDSCPK